MIDALLANPHPFVPARQRHDEPIPGANDGTSGVAVLLALLPVLRDALNEEAGFTIAFFDGEELGRPDHGGYCAGSMYFAEHIEDAPGSMAQSEFGIVLDMVGDAELTIAREPNSVRQNAVLVERLWESAGLLGERAFVDATYPYSITDDHVFLSRAGIPSVLLIDYDYDAWHTHADDLDRVSGEVGLAMGDQHLFVKAEDMVLSVKLNNVTFPPYKAVIPAAFQRFALLGRDDLLHSLRRAEVMAPEKTATVRLSLNPGKLELTSDNPDLGVAHQELPIDYDGEELTAGFNARYLIEVLDVIDTQEVRLEFQGELDPCVVKPVDGPDFLGVVMPMRI